jgi:hypothetical protein
MNRPIPRLSILTFPVLLLWFSALCKAQSVCPWLNEATASGLVGKPMSAPVISGSASNVTCTFDGQKGGNVAKLSISVIQMNDPATEYARFQQKCRLPGAALPAIGNEAILCRADVSPQTHAERVVGRVRDRAFIVTVSNNARFKPPFSRGTIEGQAKAVAEQVAGILF